MKFTSMRHEDEEERGRDTGMKWGEGEDRWRDGEGQLVGTSRVVVANSRSRKVSLASRRSSCDFLKKALSMQTWNNWAGERMQ
jgi:hypothetical protein